MADDKASDNKAAGRKIADRKTADRKTADRKTTDVKALTPAQRTYEQKRAAKAGKTLEAWLDLKQKRAAEEAKAAAPPSPPKKPGLIARLLDKAHKPL